jgi:hypothetical protein
MGPFVGVVEIVCGTLLLVGLATRPAAMPLVIDMLVAIASTKLPILLGRGYWLFAHTFARRPVSGPSCTSRGQTSRCFAGASSSPWSAQTVGRSTASLGHVATRQRGVLDETGVPSARARGGRLLARCLERGASRDRPAATTPEDARWLLEGTTDDRFVRAAAHLRGFDVAMAETGYRYGELAWAGRDRTGATRESSRRFALLDQPLLAAAHGPRVI